MVAQFPRLSSVSRRRFLYAAAVWPLLRTAHAVPKSGRVVIAGAGWGGLRAAAALRQYAPGLEVTLVDRSAYFTSFSGSNRWLVGHADAPPPLQRNYAELAAARGYRFLQGEIRALERAAQLLHTSAGALPYDWLVVAPGIEEDWRAWGVDDAASVARLETEASGAMRSAADLPRLRARLQDFKGGDLVLAIPPAPYRCPPAPYERALLLAWWLKQRRLPGKVIVIDPNPLMPAYRRAFNDTWREQITYLDHARVRAIDLDKRMVSTDLDDIPFAAAFLSPPQKAPSWLAAAGLLASANDPWGAQDAASLRSGVDASVFIIGDAAGRVSSQFGHYPKTAHVAAAMGIMVAAQIAGAGAAPAWPDSVCHLLTGVAPDRGTRLEVAYRRRGDGFLMQEIRQQQEADPLAAAAAWAAAHYAEFL